MSANSPIILYAEDSEDDVLLMERALGRIDFPGTLVVMSHGLDVIDYLNGTGSYADRNQHPFPDLILLDVKMPRIGGLETLRWIRRQEPFQATPVLMFSASKQPIDVQSAYASKADAYLVKPLETQALTEMMSDVLKLCGRTREEIDPRRIRGSALLPAHDRGSEPTEI